MCVPTKANKRQIVRNSSVNEVDERYRMNHAIVVKLSHPYTQFTRNVRLSHWRIVTTSAHPDFFIIAPYKYSYFLTEEFLVDNICGSSVNSMYKLNFYYKV